jgi:hypothetical protein
MSSFRQHETYNQEEDIVPQTNQFDFAKDLKFGQIGERLVIDVLNALVNGSLEAKTDRYRNGNMVVETDQNPHNSGWKKSGINVTKAKWWVYVYALDGGIVIVDVNRLKRYLRMNKDIFNESTKRMLAADSDNPAKGWILKPQHVMDMLINKKYDANGA